jgi:PncC family amidohydrolase
MAAGARKVLGSDVGLAITGVAGPTPQDGVPIGTVWCALAGPGPSLEAVRMQLPGDRERIREFAAISALDVLRRRMMEPAPA